MQLSQGFFELNWRFARRVAEVSGLPLERALLDYTHLYPRFGLGRDFDSAHPAWGDFLAGLREAPDPAAWMHAFYQVRLAEAPPPAASPGFGCFYFTQWSDSRIRLHFQNADPSAHGPLGEPRRAQRRAELSAMFAHLKATVGDGATVVGGSWLYHLQAYRRLFPPAYLASARAGEPEFQFIALWGQFIDRHGQVRAGPAGVFLDRLRQATSLAGVAASFPLSVLRLEGPIRDFYAFYGV